MDKNQKEIEQLSHKEWVEEYSDIYVKILQDAMVEGDSEKLIALVKNAKERFLAWAEEQQASDVDWAILLFFCSEYYKHWPISGKGEV